MTTQYGTQPTILGLEHIYDHEAQQLHETWQALKLDDVVATMPHELQTFSNDADEQIRYVDLHPIGERAEQIAVMRLPIANGWRPHMYIRAELMRQLLPQPTLLRVFPNDTRREATLSLSRDSSAKVAQDNFEPIAALQQASIEGDFGESTPLDIAGFSLGAAIGLAHARLANTRALYVGEVPNLLPRTTRQLNADTIDGSLSLAPINRAILDAQIPALADAFGVRRERTGVRQFFIGGAGFALDTLLRNNKLIKQGLTTNTGINDLLKAVTTNADMKVVMARAERSKVMPEEAAKQLAEIIAQNAAGESYTIAGYGHEAGDNIWIGALLMRRAVQLAATQS